MKKQLFYSALTALTLLLTACSGDDNNSTNDSGNQYSTKIVGKWVIYKAVYDGSDPITYEINGECGREILEFSDNKTVSETLYVDFDCSNGVGNEYDWWVVKGGQYVIGYQNSDAGKVITISGNELTVDAQEDWGYIKYYKKVK